MHKALSLVGLGGTRARYTTGDFWWCVGLAWGSGFLVAVALVMAVLRYGG